MSKKTGRLFIVSGPSGSGKDTVLKEIFKRCPEIEFSISSITRPMREGEVEGEKYNFISREKFEDMLKNDQLLEHNVFVGNYYGTPKAPVDKAILEGKDMIIEVDVNGAFQIKKKLPNAISIFIMPPSLETLRARLTGRGTEKAEVIEKRLGEALSEISRAAEYDYIVVNNVLEEAVNDAVAIIKTDRMRTDRNLHLINDVLSK
ncbi:MAG: guanylate kinase [Clostridia bacterium]|nr:guanylate kinase [Clostridia bacterium]MBQ2316174.1 guanylate kinase [Clostridia bacterium]